MKKTSLSVLSFLLLLCLVGGLLAPSVGAAGMGDGLVEPLPTTTTTTTTAIAAPTYAGVEPITLEATASLLLDMDSGQILHADNAEEIRYPASITKIMTALLTLEAVGRGELSLDSMITAEDSARADLSSDSSTANIQPGESMSVKDLLYCLMVASANEAANILAVAVSGDIPTFVAAMNERAAQLGMKNTHFVNPHGLHNPEHYSSAYDISLMAREAMTHAPFREIVSAGQYTTAATNLSDARVLYSTNGLLSSYRYRGYELSGTIGVKTGHTAEAGYCLCAAATQKGATLMSVVLGCENIGEGSNVQRKQFSESRRLLKWGFENFSHATLLDADTYLEEIPVRFSAKSSHVIAQPAESIEVLVPGAYDETKLDLRLNLDRETATAPINKGDVLGTVMVIYGGEQYAEVDMLAVSDVALSLPMSFISCVNAVLSNLFVRILLAMALVLFVIGGLRRWRARQSEERKAQRLLRQKEKKQAAQARRQREVHEYDLRKAEKDHKRQEQTLRKQEEQERRKREQQAEQERRRQEADRRKRQEQERHREEVAQRRRREENRYPSDAQRRPPRTSYDDRSYREPRGYDTGHRHDRDRRPRRPNDWD